MRCRSKPSATCRRRCGIKWSDSLVRRLELLVAQIGYYRGEVADLLNDGLAEGPERRPLLEFDNLLAVTAREARAEIVDFQAVGRSADGGRARLEQAARRMHAGRPGRLTDTGPLVAIIGQALAVAEDPAVCRRLAVLRAEIAGHGLGIAHIHVRLNATQVHNAIRKTIGMEAAPDDPAHRRSNLAGIGRLLEGVEPVSI